MFMTLLRTLAGRRSLKVNGSHQVLLGRSQFWRILIQEKERSDRNGHGFALVVIDVHAMNDHILWRVVNALAARIRHTDVMGWLGVSKLGVILTDAAPEGAKKLLQHLVSVAGLNDGRPIPARLFAYGPAYSTLCD